MPAAAIASVAGLAIAVLIATSVGPARAAGVPPGPVGDTDAPVTGLAPWTGGVQLYRAGAFTTQRSWLWCTAADVQIARNLVHRGSDHSTAGQRRYFDWMRTQNHYDLPLSAGVDPAGWTAGMRRYVDDRYRLVASRTFDDALRSAVLRIRQTRLPVALAVSHGNHGWLLVGFTATADPAATSDFRVTSVRVVGPLWGLQSRNGYDMRPDTKLSPAQLARFLTPWRYAPLRMVWDGRFVTIQPIPTTAAKASPVTAAATPSATSTPDPSASPSMSPSAGSSAAPSDAPRTVPPSASPGDVALGTDDPAASVGAQVDHPGPADPGPSAWTTVLVPVAVAALVVAFLLAALAGLGLRTRRRRR